MDPSKIQSVLEWPVPINGVRGFLGLTGYYCKFIRDYEKISRPLTALTKNDGFFWSSEAQKEFELLKEKMTTRPVLALPDFSKEFIIESDASRLGLGAILMQEGRPVSYFSKTPGERNLTKSAYEKELMIWKEISLDFITGLPKFRGLDAVLVVVDQLSKYSHFIPLKHLYSAKTVAEVFTKDVVKLHGIPASILSDKDLIFSRIYPDFHVSLLKKAVGNYSENDNLPTDLEGDLNSPLEPTAVLASWVVTKKWVLIPQLLIKWKGKPTEEAIWEEKYNTSSQFPHFKLEDKPSFHREEYDRPLIHKESQNTFLFKNFFKPLI
ncbi:uncharacterized protein LOC113859838 [Abrus precatorius]|uniref:Uncharacterized protein LOC113859838 n=1 Tax=Abrus precatorius TaxID=3816 RepID=A0A8B8L0Z5_ABRPR|nr:uncharacterized protein LOC113859838 [Abrus precatorius]